jgi:HAD superfamily hydrolase (TIGR01549 family)
MIKAFIFDIDGTLIDSNDFHARAWEKAFAANGKAVAFQNIRSHMGKGLDQLLPEFLNADEIERLGKAISDLRGEIFKREYLPQVRPFPKVRELFKRIREKGARIALASSAKKQEVEDYKIIAQIDDLVEKSTSSEDADKSKPQPDVFHAAMAQLGNPERESVLVVGDTPYDSLAAVKARLPVIGVLCGGFSEKVLRSNGCRAVYRDPADLLEHLEHILKYHYG